MRSLGTVTYLRNDHLVADIQLGEDGRYRTLVWDERRPHQTQRLIGPYQSIAEAEKTAIKLLGLGRKKNRKARRNRKAGY